VLFVQLACPTNFVCGIGTQISGFGSGSTNWNVSAPFQLHSSGANQW